MQKLSARLASLETRDKSRRVISGLSHFYDLIEAVDKVGGGRVLLDRLDAGIATDDDCAAVAAVPGGVRAIREHVTGLERFYGGQP
ncbi:hypothetical protein [Rhodoferax fermentans]|uniref:Uncharacterized protein n=1 Tax=Rhodoferax fermentans TaxID=28066 RepID=A0A1T1ANL6_RHOFE|nr:hypothetical protein [Rhodoferax fermentans]MBK1685520.1 hypothetical protein [Rhodoferax fermentans]OOV05644.1 hypothetical protein RF819_02000 [Rhodoferax fermentans]